MEGQVRDGRSKTPGSQRVIPVVDRMVAVNIAEGMMNAKSQESITSDTPNAA
jgi:hypothetical protein